MAEEVRDEAIRLTHAQGLREGDGWAGYLHSCHGRELCCHSRRGGMRMPTQRRTKQQTEETGPRRGDYVLVEDGVVRVGGDGLPDLEPRYRVMVVGRTRLSAVTEVVSPERYIPREREGRDGAHRPNSARCTPSPTTRGRGSAAWGCPRWGRSPGPALTTPGPGSPAASPRRATWRVWRRPGGTGSGPWPRSPGSTNGPAGEPADEPADAPVDEPDEPGDAERPADGRDIACPECGAAPGKSCRYPSGYYYSRGHTSRRPGGVVSAMVDDARLDMECPECKAEAGKPCRVVLVRGHAARR